MGLPADALHERPTGALLLIYVERQFVLLEHVHIGRALNLYIVDYIVNY